MSDAPDTDDRRLDLLADRALQGLDGTDRAELARLLAAEPIEDDEALDRAAAALAAAVVEDESGPLPGSLAAKVKADARDYFTRARPRRPAIVKVLPWMGWVVAAAASVVAVVSIPKAEPPAPPEPTAAERMERLARSEALLAFHATDHPLARGAGGELVWSGRGQEGYLRLRGLAPVERSKGVYQLWIWDTRRDARYPIDGGVFTVDDDRGPTVVPIRAALPVAEPVRFAVTLEPPGGVVVSDRRRIMLVAEARP